MRIVGLIFSIAALIASTNPGRAQIGSDEAFRKYQERFPGASYADYSNFQRTCVTYGGWVNTVVSNKAAGLPKTTTQRWAREEIVRQSRGQTPRNAMAIEDRLNALVDAGYADKITVHRGDAARVATEKCLAGESVVAK